MGRRPKSPPRDAAAEALETLVQQFSQPLAFLRELVQNSLDANTNRVDVRVSHRPAEGCALVEVTDTGEGMDRQAIDSGLTRLFASSKEGDLTKIGKFGVGFVSVFAIRPLAVVVDTGRGGEAWRLVFNPDRSFDRNRLEQPFDGTCVSVYVPVRDPKEFSVFERDCRDTVHFWCKHCDVEVAFNGQSVLEPLGLGAPLEADCDVQGTRVVVAPSTERNPFFGFYNRGLTLLEGRGSPVAGVTFKCRSRYLEHTITRDNVLHDEHYEKALAVIRQVAYQVLPVRLAQRLAEAPGDAELWKLLEVVAGYPELTGEFLAVPCLPGVIGFYTLQQAREHPVYYAHDSPLARAAVDQGVLVLQPGPAVDALRAFGCNPQWLEESHSLALACPAPAELEPLLNAATALLRPLRLTGVAARLLPAGGQLSLRCPALERVVSRREGGLLAIAVDHPWVLSLAPLVARDPGLAAYLLVRAALLEQGLEADSSALLETTLRLRARP